MNHAPNSISVKCAKHFYLYSRRDQYSRHLKPNRSVAELAELLAVQCEHLRYIRRVNNDLSTTLNLVNTRRTVKRPPRQLTLVYWFSYVTQVPSPPAYVDFI